MIHEAVITTDEDELVPSSNVATKVTLYERPEMIGTVALFRVALYSSTD
ncbi:MAG: hypothetical protein JRN15_15200 [Nitrososphaerota archaeon]|nr:hypothetical protein [Nitrososphaerota archaeon]